MTATRTIHLGFEIGTGLPVAIPLRHLAVTGQTQEAGKTTTLEALIARSNLRALTFVTKRGESAFRDTRLIRPYFRERADWQYVSAILEATLRERLKFERSWIMRVCKGAATLRDVQRNVERDLKGSRGLNESVLTTLHAYLEMVVPQISQTDFAPSLAIAAGVNAMDLTGLSLELQSLIIRSALEWVYEREDNTVVLIPEAWEFIPQNRSSPVKLACEQLIRKGAGLRNYVWLDSQDIAAVHKDILRSVPVWILGVQRESNEVKRLLEHVPGAKPKPREVMQLGLGEFIACFGKETRRVYVQPAWMDEEHARAHALGAPLPPRPEQKGPNMEDQRYADLLRDYTALKRDFVELRLNYEALLREAQRPATDSSTASAPVPAPAASAGDLESIYAYVRDRLMREKDPGLLRLAANHPELHVTIARPVMALDESTLRGRLARLLVDGFFDSPATGNAAYNELQRRGFSTAKPNVYRELDKLAEAGFLTKEDGGYQKAPGALIKQAAA